MRNGFGKSILGLISIIILVVFLGGCGSSPVVPDIDINEELVVDYDIVEIPEEMHERYIPRVVINEEATVEQLEETAKEVAKQVAEDKEYRALSISFHDLEEYTGEYGLPTLGTMRYQPEGGWGDALDIEPGDYGELEFDSNLLEKDWEQQPTQREAEIFVKWNYIDEEFYAQHEGNIQEGYEMTANELGISIEEVSNAVEKVDKWAFMGR